MTAGSLIVRALPLIVFFYLCLGTAERLLAFPVIE